MREWLYRLFDYFRIKPSHEDIIIFMLPWLIVWTVVIIYIAFKIGQMRN